MEGTSVVAGSWSAGARPRADCDVVAGSCAASTRTSVALIAAAAFTITQNLSRLAV